MPKHNKAVFRILFQHRDQLIELYATGVKQSSMMAFIEVSGLIFNNAAGILIDPSEEKLKLEFGGVKCSYIPIHSIVRIDEVEKPGNNLIRATDKLELPVNRVTPFPNSST